MKKAEWFETWFDSPYYHVLYQHHDEEEAEHLIDILFQYMHLAPSARLLDVACGRGRHAVYMAQKGFEVTGVDLSWKNIQYAQHFERDNLSFFVHDMRTIFYVNYFDAVFNLYTSFGYFNAENDHLKAIRSMSDSLKKGGLLILDFFNPETIARRLPAQKHIVHDGILFYTAKTFENGCIRKKIYLQDRGREFLFEERVKALRLEDFKKYFSKNQLIIRDVFGDYQLSPYDEVHSERMVIIGEKI